MGWRDYQENVSKKLEHSPEITQDPVQSNSNQQRRIYPRTVSRDNSVRSGNICKLPEHHNGQNNNIYNQDHWYEVLRAANESLNDLAPWPEQLGAWLREHRPDLYNATRNAVQEVDANILIQNVEGIGKAIENYKTAWRESLEAYNKVSLLSNMEA